MEQGNGKCREGSGETDGEHQRGRNHLPCLFQRPGEFKHWKLYL